jgi:hypothetical protein
LYSLDDIEHLPIWLFGILCLFREISIQKFYSTLYPKIKSKWIKYLNIELLEKKIGRNSLDTVLDKFIRYFSKTKATRTKINK